MGTSGGIYKIPTSESFPTEVSFSLNPVSLAVSIPSFVLRVKLGIKDVFHFSPDDVTNNFYSSPLKIQVIGSIFS
jgi:hypothetical protein